METDLLMKLPKPGETFSIKKIKRKPGYKTGVPVGKKRTKVLRVDITKGKPIYAANVNKPKGCIGITSSVEDIQISERGKILIETVTSIYEVQ